MSQHEHYRPLDVRQGVWAEEGSTMEPSRKFSLTSRSGRTPMRRHASSSTNNRYKRIMDASLLDEFGLSTNLERGSQVHSPSYMWLIQQRRLDEANEVYPSGTHREESGYSLEWVAGSPRIPGLERAASGTARATLPLMSRNNSYSSGEHSIPYFARNGRVGASGRMGDHKRGRNSLGSFSSSSIVSPSLAMTKSYASQSESSSTVLSSTSGMQRGGTKQLLAAYGVPQYRHTAGDDFSFDDRSVAAQKMTSALAIPEISRADWGVLGGSCSWIDLKKENFVDEGKSEERRGSIRIEDDEALADACGCHLCGTFMQYQLRGRKNEDNSEELVADIWCTRDDRINGGNEIPVGKGPHYDQGQKGSGIQVTRGLQSLIELLEADTEGSSKAGLTQSTIDSIVCHRYDSDIHGVKCSVCMDELRNGDVVKCLPCLHNFHAKCIDHWLRVNRRCPVCKYSLASCF